MTTIADVQATQLESNARSRYQDAHLEIDLANRFVLVDSRQVTLRRKEYELLSLLVENAGEVIRREELLMRVWGYSPETRTRTLDVHIRRVRKHLGSYSERYIETIFGIGYRFQPFCGTQNFGIAAISA